MKKFRLFDLQHNGGYTARFGPVDFSSPASSANPLTIELCEDVTVKVLRDGTAAYLPTMISMPDEDLAQNAGVLAEFMQSSPLGRHCVGVQAECFFYPMDGYRGAHQAANCVRTGKEALARYHRIREALGDRLRVITVGPNVPGIEALIELAVNDRVLVSIGHFGPEHELEPNELEQICESVRSAVLRGARMSTHLGNGTRASAHRHIPHIMEQLVSPQLSLGLIADGIHLPETFLRLCLMARKAGDLVLVSDASAVAGAPVGEYSFGGGEVEVVPWKESVKVAPKGNPHLLAGSCASLLDCANHLWRVIRRSGLDKTNGFTPETVRDMCSTNPLALIGLPSSVLDTIGGPEIEFESDAFRIVPS